MSVVMEHTIALKYVLTLMEASSFSDMKCVSSITSHIPLERCPVPDMKCVRSHL